MEAIGQSAVVRAQRLIAVRNVRASGNWYRQLLGFDSLPEHRHGEVYDRMPSQMPQKVTSRGRRLEQKAT